MFDPQGPLRFIQQNKGTERGLGHFRVSWDESEHNQVGSSVCGNGGTLPCEPLGFARHAGRKFSGGTGKGLPVTARGDIVGPVGGFGWILDIEKGPPRNLRFEEIEVLPDTPMILSIAYPLGTTFNISANAAPWCYAEPGKVSCLEEFQAVSSLSAVREGPGNQYHVDSSGVVSFRISQSPKSYVGRPQWFIPSKTDTGLGGTGFAVERFERAGVYLPRATFGPSMTLKAECAGTGPYCAESGTTYDPDVCPPGYQQKAYDYCCSNEDDSNCIFAGGSAPTPLPPPNPAPVSPSNPAPTPPSNPAPIPTSTPPTAPAASSACFSRLNSVVVRGKGTISIADLAIDDYVQSSQDGTFSRVYSMAHKDHDRSIKYLRIYTNQGSRLEISERHILFLNGVAAMAGDVKVGDWLGKLQKVTRIQKVTSQGLFAPLTERGEILVSGVHVSSYVAVLSIEPTIQVWAYHILLYPMRLLCSLANCRSETYIEGVSSRLHWLIWPSNVISNQLPWIQVTILVLVLLASLLVATVSVLLASFRLMHSVPVPIDSEVSKKCKRH